MSTIKGMERLKAIVCLLTALLVLPAVACGAFVKVCDCSATTHMVTTVCQCSGHTHEHEVPVEHRCRHEEYSMQVVSPQVTVPTPLIEQPVEVPVPSFHCSELQGQGIVVCEWLHHPAWLPPGDGVLPLLI